MMLWQRKSNSTGLKRRIAYAFTLLIAVLALLCALAVKNAFEYAESTLTGDYMSDINETLLRTLDAGNSVTLPLAMTFYCGVKKPTADFQVYLEGVSEDG